MQQLLRELHAQYQKIQPTAQAVIARFREIVLSKSEVEEAAMKCSWLARYWGLACKYRIYPELAFSQHEYWQALSPPPSVLMVAAKSRKPSASAGDSQKMAEQLLARFSNLSARERASSAGDTPQSTARQQTLLLPTMPTTAGGRAGPVSTAEPGTSNSADAGVQRTGLWASSGSTAPGVASLDHGSRAATTPGLPFRHDNAAHETSADASAQPPSGGHPASTPRADGHTSTSGASSSSPPLGPHQSSPDSSAPGPNPQAAQSGAEAEAGPGPADGLAHASLPDAPAGPTMDSHLLEEISGLCGSATCSDLLEIERSLRQLKVGAWPALLIIINKIALSCHKEALKHGVLSCFA